MVIIGMMSKEAAYRRRDSMGRADSTGRDAALANVKASVLRISSGAWRAGQHVGMGMG